MQGDEDYFDESCGVEAPVDRYSSRESLLLVVKLLSLLPQLYY